MLNSFTIVVNKFRDINVSVCPGCCWIRKETTLLSHLLIVATPQILYDFFKQIKETLSQVLGISVKSLGIKATTTDQMGFTGTGEGIAAHAVALIKSKD